MKGEQVANENFPQRYQRDNQSVEAETAGADFGAAETMVFSWVIAAPVMTGREWIDRCFPSDDEVWGEERRDPIVRLYDLN